MLKWLVTRPAAPPREVLTEDPLATLSNPPSSGKVTQVYAVSRVNPLYEEDEGVAGVEGGGESVAGGAGVCGGDGVSLRSSGYGSKETDSDGEEGVVGGVVVSCQPDFVHAICVGMRRVRSLEALAPPRPKLPRRAACTVPRPSPPRPPTHPAPLLSCDLRYVASVLTHRPPPPPTSPPLQRAPFPPEVGPDSLLTPATLRLMTPRGATEGGAGHVGSGSEEHLYETPRTPPVPRQDPAPCHHPRPPPTSSRSSPRGLSASLSRAPSRASLPRPRSRSADGVGVAGGVGGVAGVVALWAASGLKTNGRKLLVLDGDVDTPHDQDEDVFTSPPTTPSPILQGHDNPAFVGDTSHPTPLPLEEFQRRLAHRLQGAPAHRAAWLDLRGGRDLIGGRGGLARRVTFTADTRSPRARAASPRTRLPRPPSPRPSMRLQPAPHSHYRPPWTTPGLHQLLAPLDSSAGPWGYGSLGTAPHPNPGCVSEQCHDFTLDLQRSEKQRILAKRRRRRRRWCVMVVVVAGLAGLVAVVVALSLYATRGGRGGTAAGLTANDSMFVLSDGTSV